MSFRDKFLFNNYLFYESWNLTFFKASVLNTFFNSWQNEFSSFFYLYVKFFVVILSWYFLWLSYLLWFKAAGTRLSTIKDWSSLGLDWLFIVIYFADNLAAEWRSLVLYEFLNDFKVVRMASSFYFFDGVEVPLKWDCFLSQED
jgi:glucan phosphoethanolaminetransferase (alkaline phosphatase superfamily)